MMPQVVLAAVFFALFYATQARALRVTFFNQKDFKGDSYTFYGGVREVGSDCTPCVKVVSCPFDRGGATVCQTRRAEPDWIPLMFRSGKHPGGRATRAPATPWCCTTHRTAQVSPLSAADVLMMTRSSWTGSYHCRRRAGRSSNKLPATSGDLWSIAFNSGKELKRAGRAMQFIPAASIESFRLCTVPEDRQ